MALQSAWEVFAPAARDEVGDVRADEKLVGVAGLHARVDDERQAVRDVVAAQLGRGGVDVRGRLEARPSRPEEVGGAGRHGRVIMEDDERPVAEYLLFGEPRGRARLGFVLSSLDDE